MRRFCQQKQNCVGPQAAGDAGVPPHMCVDMGWMACDSRSSSSPFRLDGRRAAAETSQTSLSPALPLSRSLPEPCRLQCEGSNGVQKSATRIHHGTEEGSAAQKGRKLI